MSIKKLVISENIFKLINYIVPPTGFEPVTSSLPMTRSTAGAMAAYFELI